MSWFRRLSRDRFSKYEPDFHVPEQIQRDTGDHTTTKSRGLSGASQQQQQQQQQQRPTTSYGEQHTATKDAQFTSPTGSNNMLRRQPNAGATRDPRASGSPHDLLSNGHPTAVPHPSASADALAPGSPARQAAGTPLRPAPDPLTRAFNDALKPYRESIARFQADLDAAHAHIQSLEADRAALQHWLDRRGLRPDLPPALAATLPDASSAVAAGALATQLDRKATMLNFSLHQLADALPDGAGGLPVSTVSNALSATLRPVRYLSGLPGGAAFAFEALVKLAGNFNSHTAGVMAAGQDGEDDEGAEGTDGLGARGHKRNESRSGVDDFYENLDFVMGDVVRKRVAAVREGEEYWDVDKDVRRLEKTAAFLRKELGIQRYFSRSLEMIKREGGRNNGVGMGEEGLTGYSEESR